MGMDLKDRDDPAKESPKGGKPREGSLRSEVERAERHPERPATGKQLVGGED